MKKIILPLVFFLFGFIVFSCKKDQAQKIIIYNNSKILRPNELAIVIGKYNGYYHDKGHYGAPSIVHDSTFAGDLNFAAVPNQSSQINCIEFKKILKFNHKDSINGLYYFSSDTLFHQIYAYTFNLKDNSVSGNAYSGGLGGYSSYDFTGNK